MRIALLTLAVALSVASSGALRRAEAAPPPPVRQDLAALLPKGTALFAEFDSLGGFERWQRETTLGRIYTEPEVQQFVRGLGSALRGAMARFQEGFNPLGVVGLTPADFAGIKIRRAGFALVDASLDKLPDGRAHVDFVLTVQFRAGAKNGHKITHALRTAAEMFTQVQFEERKIAGRPVWVALAGEVEICLLSDGDRFLLTTQRERMAQMIEAMGAPYADRLAAAPRFAKIRSAMKADRCAFFAYADVPRLARRGLQIARRFARKSEVDEFERIWKILGLDAVQAVAAADIAAGPDWRTEMAVTLSERRGLFKLAQKGKASHRFARHVPAGSLLYGAESFDARELWATVKEIAQGIHPTFGEAMDEGLAEANTALGVDLDKDLFGALGTEWAAYLGAPPGGGLVPDFGLFATVRDKNRLHRTIATMVDRCTKAMARDGGRAVLRTSAFRGHVLQTLELTGRGGDPIPVAPAWAVGDDFVVAAPFPSTVRNALLEKASLAGQPDFQALSRAVPAGSSSVMYLDTKALIGWLYNTATPLLQGFQGAINRELEPFGVVLNFQDLPPATALTRHLTGTMFYTSVGDDTIRTGWLSPLGAGGILVPVAAIGAVAAGAFVLRDVPAAEPGPRVRLRRTQQLLREERERNRRMQERLERIEALIAELKKQIR